MSAAAAEVWANQFLRVHDGDDDSVEVERVEDCDDDSFSREEDDEEEACRIMC